MFPNVTHALSRGDLLPLEQQRAAGCCPAAQLDATSCVELKREKNRAGSCSLLVMRLLSDHALRIWCCDLASTATAFTS